MDALSALREWHYWLRVVAQEALHTSRAGQSMDTSCAGQLRARAGVWRHDQDEGGAALGRLRSREDVEVDARGCEVLEVPCSQQRLVRGRWKRV